ncbi:hypothetical protein ACNKFW_12320 (plasmid) [Paracoccus sp. TD-10]|uniref:hypothetical protein n=1 Tax=Paracoccus sp. TD-10 TaxID=3395918 RepID=UPI003AADF943
MARRVNTCWRSRGLIPRNRSESNCICSCLGLDGPVGRSCIGLFLSGDDITGRASPKTVPTQKVIEIRQGRERYVRCAEVHAGASRRVEHPRSHDHEDARQHLDMDKLTGLASVDTLDPKLSAEKRVPPVMHLNKLPDMGRMNG